jgi:glyoxylase I family protein
VVPAGAGLERIPPRFPHFGNEETGHAVVFADPAAGVMIGLHDNIATVGSHATALVGAPSLQRETSRRK